MDCGSRVTVGVAMERQGVRQCRVALKVAET